MTDAKGRVATSPLPALDDVRYDPVAGTKVRLSCVTYGAVEQRAALAMTAALLYAKEYGVRGSLHFFETSIVPEGRNRAVRSAIDDGATHLFFVDSDVVLEEDTLVKLLFRNVDIVSGLYPNRHDNLVTAFCRKNGDRPGSHCTFSWQIVDMPGLHKASAVGAGCLLVKTSALQRMYEYWQSLDEIGKLRHRTPWFEYIADGPTDTIGEDVAFCDMATEAGLDIYVDSSALCKHIGKAAYSLGFGKKNEIMRVEPI